MSLSMALFALTLPSQPMSFAPQEEGACCVGFLPNSKTFVYGTIDGQLCISGPNSRVLYEPKGSAVALAVSPNGQTVACCFHGWAGTPWSGLVIIWDIEKSREVARIRQRADAIAFSPDGARLATAGKSGLRLWDVSNGAELRTLEDVSSDCVTFAPYGQTLAVANHSSVRLYDAATGKLVRRIGGVAGYIRGLAFSPDGRRLAVTGSGAQRMEGDHVVYWAKSGDDLMQGIQDGQFKVWEVATGQELLAVTAHGWWTCGAAFSPSGRMVAFADDTSIEVWDIATNKCSQRFESDETWVGGLAIGDNGRLLASANAGGIDLWELEEKSSPKEGSVGVLFDDLKMRDPKNATRAVFALAAEPGQSLPLLRKELRPVRGASREELANLVNDLGSNEFVVRQKAATELEKLERVAGGALQDLLRANPPLDVRRQAEYLLGQLEEPNLSTEIIRSVRAVEVLERINSPESRQILSDLANGHSEGRLTAEAKAALKRMIKQ
jgi:WD domain, G-beta repeat/WD40-like Beta Propeller Repeat